MRGDRSMGGRFVVEAALLVPLTAGALILSVLDQHVELAR